MIEDDSHLAEIYARHFALHKCLTKAVRNFSEADKKIKRAKPDLIIVDIALEEKAGLAWLRTLRTVETTAEIPIVVLTGLGGREEIVEALKNGANKYFLKSQITPHELAGQIKLILSPKI